MKRLSLLVLLFAVLSVVFFLLLIFLRIPFPLYSLISYQDAFDLLTPLVLIPVYWLMYKAFVRDQDNLPSDIVFMVFAAAWAAGQGMHLAANSINNLIGNLAKDHILDVNGTVIGGLTYFFDEHLSHYLWHIGVIGLAALLIYASWDRYVGEPTNWWLVAPAGVFYGFTLFCIFLEGQTLPIGLPFVIVCSFLVFVWRWKQFKANPMLAFWGVSCLLASLLLIGWRFYWGGFLQFSDVGLI